ncbi:P-loop containing nucleoside triphosphate hydrolase protein [Lasiosphaeria hispida]|uniref:P-loop containing nucleoside triphosphate hydrolase protein n=1 Tax=Lasiosphaeria hispida TaxID=260671 RepID=A0AAJ0MJ36_9PEZI|nr:P-loop containing nucleoside triphosphate hydrolase protein [Lasiosphaeria hispida]
MPQFQKWLASINPTRVDIVGDFAGRGVFAIHGEALLTHCLESARVDFDHGFQLLHAVHSVETFLAKLSDRGCIFNIMWFEEESDICMPTEARADRSRASKYRLARAVLIQHLSSPISHGEAKSAKLSYLFPSLRSGTFCEYLDSHPLHFFLGSSTYDGSGDIDVNGGPLEMLHLMLSAGYCVAFIEDLEFRSSKVYLSIATPNGKITALEAPEGQPTLPRVASPYMMDTMKRLAGMGIDGLLTAREFISICALSSVLSLGKKDGGKDSTLWQRNATTVLAHLVILRHCGLSQRSFPTQKSGAIATPNTPFFTKFFEAARDGLFAWSDGGFAHLEWDAFDLFDGRLYINTTAGLSGILLPQQLSREVANLVELLSTLSGIDISGAFSTISRGTIDRVASRIKAPGRDQPLESEPSVLPFNHPVMDQYLAAVRLNPNGVAPESLLSGKIFQELTHWHNARRPVDPKYIAKPPGYFARRHQKLMSNTIAYSASLTGASGKILDPETIVVSAPNTRGQRRAKGPYAPKEMEKRSQTKDAPKSNQQKALNQGEALRLKRLAVLSQSVATTWAGRCMEFEKQPSIVKRYLKAERYFSALSASHKQIIGGEVLLYLSQVLLQARSNPETPRSAIAMEGALQIALRPTGASPPAAKRALAFKPLAIKGTRLLPAGTTPREFLLEHCGPYLERSFDSAPDSRVTSFNPDAWQRKVLDAIDADKSVLAIAPTSAGKTLISFYAMKKVLQANDDDILVYVAPTKALVNQIAAEIQARFSKSYGAHEGRSVWAIHTRDYRINSCKGCQILVTVPSILQILLLAPSNARRPQDFSRRVKRIIFDEVHCIGQSDEGVIWEQLLLLAPCPIIALSATIANPDDFKSWLERSQGVKGYELEMVIHSSRYSDLRKFLYDPAPSVFEFTGLAPVERLPLPGLDSEELSGSDATPFLFIHPIGSIVDRNRDTLNDASLEPRDCLSLWKCMDGLQSAEYTLPLSLNPEKALPAAVRKSDVVRWEAALKDQLAEWMASPKSPFNALREELRGQRYSRFCKSYSDAPWSDDRRSSLGTPGKRPTEVSSRSVFSLVMDLRAGGALPAILFNYDRMKCQAIAVQLFETLDSAESKYRETDSAWLAKIAEFEKWKKARVAKKAARTLVSGPDKSDEGGWGKAEVEREAASRDISRWEGFDPNGPLARFSFADTTKISREELEERLRTIYPDAVRPIFIHALRRGVGVHHAGMNRQYRQVVEMLFRKGYLSVVVATGTLAMGINMPCKTVVFTGDSIYLTALNYRQASGRAGRRGFDVLGNIVFHDIPPHRALEIMSAKLPDLRGQFPTSVTLILRLFVLLHGTDNSSFAAGAVKSLLTQNRLYLGGPAAKMSIAHHLRFSIDYLRRQHLLSGRGAPLNFSGLIGHLYYTESAAFAFHALLQEGYFHEVCAGFSPSMDPARWRDMGRELVLTLSHLFARIPRVFPSRRGGTRAASSAASISLPKLPSRAYEILERHNAQTFAIFRDYARSYAAQHLEDAPDDSLPLTRHKVPSAPTLGALSLPCLPPVTIRSPFAALSGFTDSDFSTVYELCDTVRAGVPLEASVVPGVPLDGVVLNSYLLDFFKHGDVVALTRDNGIKKGDVWFRLKDFSLVLATVVTSMECFLRSGAGEGDEDVWDGEQDEYDEEGSGWDGEQEEAAAAPVKAPNDAREKKGRTTKKKKRPVADSWEDEDLSSSQSDGESELESWDDEEPGLEHDGDCQSLVGVCNAFRMLHSEYEKKFLKIWA